MRFIEFVEFLWDVGIPVALVGTLLVALVYGVLGFLFTR